MNYCVFLSCIFRCALFFILNFFSNSFLQFRRWRRAWTATATARQSIYSCDTIHFNSPAFSHSNRLSHSNSHNNWHRHRHIRQAAKMTLPMRSNAFDRSVRMHRSMDHTIAHNARHHSRVAINSKNMKWTTRRCHQWLVLLYVSFEHFSSILFFDNFRFFARKKKIRKHFRFFLWIFRLASAVSVSEYFILDHLCVCDVFCLISFNLLKNDDEIWYFLISIWRWKRAQIFAWLRNAKKQNEKKCRHENETQRISRENLEKISIFLFFPVRILLMFFLRESNAHDDVIASTHFPVLESTLIV